MPQVQTSGTWDKRPGVWPGLLFGHRDFTCIQMARGLRPEIQTPEQLEADQNPSRVNSLDIYEIEAVPEGTAPSADATTGTVPVLTLGFSTIRSIGVVIQWLEELREAMIGPSQAVPITLHQDQKALPAPMTEESPDD